MGSSNKPVVSKPGVVIVIPGLRDLLELRQLLEAAFLEAPHFPMARSRGANELSICWIDTDFGDLLVRKVVSCNYFVSLDPVIQDSFCLKILV